jgi:hypothetical protein
LLRHVLQPCSRCNPVTAPFLPATSSMAGRAAPGALLVEGAAWELHVVELLGPWVALVEGASCGTLQEASARKMLPVGGTWETLLLAAGTVETGLEGEGARVGC